MSETIRLLESKAEELGLQVSFLGIEHLKELEQEFEEARKHGNQTVYERYLNSFVFHPPIQLEDAKSIVIIACPQSISHVHFTWQGELWKTMLPPTYLAAEAKKKVKELLDDSLGKNGHRWVPTKLPLKFITVKSGLGRYGRNNICYVPGFGSFARLEAVYTTLPVARSILPIQALETCVSCYACMGNCPTESIRADYTMIEAGRCLTYLNETAGDFPEWVKPQWHHALFGCIRCQELCPENQNVIENRQTYTAFSEEETRLILTSPFSLLPSPITERLTAFCPPEEYGTLVRNLRSLLPL